MNIGSFEMNTYSPAVPDALTVRSVAGDPTMAG
jgi:hypothetical protein